MSNFVKNFKKFQKNKRNDSFIVENTKTNESVIERDSKFIVGGITIDQSFVNKYVNRVKKDTGKDLYQSYSRQQLAEELVNWMVSKNSDADQVPASAILGGADDMESQVSDVSMENEPLNVDDVGITSDEEIESEIEPSVEIDDEPVGDIDSEFESPIEEAPEEGEDISFDELPDGESDTLTADDLEEGEEDEEDEDWDDEGSGEFKDEEDEDNDLPL